MAIMAFFACLPVDWASGLGGYIGRTLGPRMRLTRRALGNLRRAIPANTDAQNHRILLGMWDNLGRSAAEFPHLARICAATSGRVEVVNPEAAARLVADGQPGIVFGAHLGNWEVCASMVHDLLRPSILSVYRSANNPWIDRLSRYRLRGRQTVAKGPAGGRDMLRHLRLGGHLAMYVDQKMNDGIAVPFFGRDAMTAPAIARLSFRFGCPVVPIRTERLAGAHFRLTVLPPLEMTGTGDTEADVLRTMTGINTMIEGWIRARPEQWLWLHRRWPD